MEAVLTISVQVFKDFFVDDILHFMCDSCSICLCLNGGVDQLSWHRETLASASAELV